MQWRTPAVGWVARTAAPWGRSGDAALVSAAAGVIADVEASAAANPAASTPSHRRDRRAAPDRSAASSAAMLGWRRAGSGERPRITAARTDLGISRPRTGGHSRMRRLARPSAIAEVPVKGRTPNNAS